MLNFILIVTVLATLFMCINTLKNNSRNTEVEIDDFKSILIQDGISVKLTNQILTIIKELQIEENSEDLSVLNRKVLRRINKWNYSNVLTEKDYEEIYLNNYDEIDSLRSKSIERYGRLPLNLGGGEHTEHWSEKAKLAETAITQKISDVIHECKNLS